MKVTCIAALGENFVIGKNDQLPWHLPADMAWFKQQTMYCTVIIGRRSYEILGGPLPGRPTIVLTRQTNYPVPQNVRTASSLAEALQLAKAQPQVFILGGQEPYREAIEGGLANDMLLTRVHASPDGDAFFPKWDEAQWKLEGEKKHPADAKNEFAMTFQHWVRKA